MQNTSIINFIKTDFENIGPGAGVLPSAEFCGIEVVVDIIGIAVPAGVPFALVQRLSPSASLIISQSMPVLTQKSIFKKNGEREYQEE